MSLSRLYFSFFLIPERPLFSSLRNIALGALMSLNGNILALFDQLGLLEDVMKISLVSLNSSLFTEKMEKITTIDVKSHFD